MSDNKFKVLLIDSNKFFQLLIESMAIDYGFEVKSAQDGKSALKILGEFIPDVIFAEDSVKGIADFETVKTIRANSRFDSTPIILISLELTDKLITEALSAGVSDFLKKPVRQAEMQLKIESLRNLKFIRDEIGSLNIKLEKEKKILAKYFSDDLVDSILSEELSTELGGTNLIATSLFFDIRNSTAIAEQVEPKQFAEFLSEIFTDIMDLVYGHQGSVNKMLGDGVFATFGAPISTNQDAYNCLKCALEIRNYMTTFNDVRPDYLKEPVTIGIGVATGKVFAGNIGSVRRMEYTVLGDSVNVASRLQALTKEAGVDILIEGRTQEILSDRLVSKKVFLDIRGKVNATDIYSVEKLLK